MPRPKVLYIAYWGAAEPLGQSLILPSVSRLAALGAELTLVTFEKPADLARKSEMTRITESLRAAGVTWLPLCYHKQPKVPATAYDIARGCARGVLTGLKTRFDIIHARTFVGGLMGLMLAPALRAKLIYHNEGFYPDEQVDAGVWDANSSAHRVAKCLEARMYSRADAIISMSHRGKKVIERLPAVDRNNAPVIVVPSCVDLDRFQFSPGSRAAREPFRFVYSGSVGGRYHLDKLARFVSIAAEVIGPLKLSILTHSDRKLVESMLRAGGLRDDQWSIASIPYSSMPEALSVQDVGLHFSATGISGHGGSPTKIGEYWGSGLPAVVTPNAGDTDEIICSKRVGVIVASHTDEAYGRAARELQSLLEDQDLRARCRRAAESHYALNPACERQIRLYRELVSLAVQRPAAAQTSELRDS